MRSREAKFLTRGLTALVGSLLATGLGLAALTQAGLLTRLSYDLPFIWRGKAALGPSDVALVYLDDDSAKKLKDRKSVV